MKAMLVETKSATAVARWATTVLVLLLLATPLHAQQPGACEAPLDAALAPLNLPAGAQIDYDALVPLAQSLAAQPGALQLQCFEQVLVAGGASGRRELAALTIALLAPSPSATEALRRQIENENPYVADAAHIAVGYLPAGSISETANRLLADAKDGAVRAYGAHLLAAIGNGATRDQLSAFADTDNVILRAAVEHALRSLEVKLQLPSPDQDRWAADGVAYLRAVPQAPFDANPAQGDLTLAERLTTAGRRFFLPYLCDRLSTLEPPAALLIGFQGDQAGVSCLAPYAGQAGLFGDAVRDALGRLGGGAALRALEAGVKPKGDANYQLAATLARIGDAASLAVLDRLRTDTNYEAATRAAFTAAVRELRRKPAPAKDAR